MCIRDRIGPLDTGTTFSDRFSDFDGNVVSETSDLFANDFTFDIGDYTTSFPNIGERFVTPIAIHNQTDGTMAPVRWLHLDDDPGLSDDFGVVLDLNDDSFLEIGDEWSINGSTTLILQSGDASDFILGTYTGAVDGAVGEVTLVIQSESIPEPSSTFVLSIFGISSTLLVRRKRGFGYNG